MPIDLLIGHQQEDGGYKDDEGLHYDDAEQYLVSRVLDFCPCGNGTTLEYVYESLKLVGFCTTQYENGVPFDIYYKLWRSKCNLFFGNEMAEDFMWHWLDSKELTEHGGNVSGGWLTDKGYAMIEAIKKVMSQDED